jgi:lipid II:glycine glycyltransferase (peptidoglycan interpeptide bridge formation enzyme)
VLTDNKISSEQWSAFVSSHPLGTVLQTNEWGDLKSNFGWKKHLLVLTAKEMGQGQDEQIVAGAMLLSKPLPLVGKRIFYAPRGPLIDFNNSEQILAFMVKIRELLKKEKGIALKIDPEISEEQAKLFRQIGFMPASRQFQPRVTYLLDLSKDLNSLLAGFEEKTRYNIRLSLRHGVTVKQMSSEEGMNLFYDIHTETAQRDHFLVYGSTYYQKVRELIVEKGHGEIFIAFYQDKPVAGVVVFGMGKKLTYLYGASKSEARNVMPNHALHWHILEWAKKQSYTTYDLWGIPAKPEPSHPLWGVYRFKKGFNGRLVKWIGLQDYVLDPFWYWVFEKGLTYYKNLIKKGKISDSLGE